MKTAEEILEEIERRIKYFERVDAIASNSDYAAHVVLAFRLLQVWIEADDVTHDLGEEITIVHKGNQVLRTFRNEDY